MAATDWSTKTVRSARVDGLASELPQDVRAYHPDLAPTHVRMVGASSSICTTTRTSRSSAANTRRRSGRPRRSCGGRSGTEVGPRAACAIRATRHLRRGAPPHHGAARLPRRDHYVLLQSGSERSGGTGGIICANTDDTRRYHRAAALPPARPGRRRPRSRRSPWAERARARRRRSSANASDLPFALIYIEDQADRNRLHAGGERGASSAGTAAPRFDRGGTSSVVGARAGLAGAVLLVPILRPYPVDRRMAEGRPPPRARSDLPFERPRARGASWSWAEPVSASTTTATAAFLHLVAGQLSASIAQHRGLRTGAASAPRRWREIDRAKRPSSAT